jgi:hypothetical protein
MSETAWPISDGNKERTRKILKPGKYTSILEEIKLVEVKVNPNFLKEGQEIGDKEPKVLFVFQPLNPGPLEDGEECTINVFATPSMNPKSKMYEVLSMMSDTGDVPKEVLGSRQKYQAYAESFKDKKFDVWCRPTENGKNNAFVRLVPLDEPEPLQAKTTPSWMKEDFDDEIPF